MTGDRAARPIPRSVRIGVAIFLAIQISVPTYQLAARWIDEGSRPTREYKYSYQMYSATKQAEFVGLTAEGVNVPLSTDDLPPILRTVAYGTSVAKMLCEANPDIVSVVRVVPRYDNAPFEC